MPAEQPRPAARQPDGVLLDRAKQLAALRHWLDVLRRTLATGDLDARVPACPDWDLRALVQHVGEIHRWVRGAILEGHPNTPPSIGPVDRSELVTWFDEGADGLLQLLSGVDPAQPCWAFGPIRTAEFWLRRQPHEHAVHAWDALASQGRSVPIDADLALDGIDEVVGMFFPRQVRLRRTPPLPQALALEPDEAAGRAWVLAGDGTTQPTAADARVGGPAEALYLLLWRRIGLDDARLTLTGDVAAARAVLAAAIVP